MARTQPITASDVEAELARMRVEIDDLKKRPESPHAKVMREFDEDHQRRYQEGQKRVAAEHEREERQLDEICASRSWVRVTCANTQVREISWREIVEEPGASMFEANTGPNSPSGPSGRWVAPMLKVERGMALAGAGQMLETSTELTRRIVASPELAQLIETAQLIVTPLTDDENRAHERHLLRTANAIPLTMRER